MVSVEGIRKVLQDVVASDLRALSEKVDALSRQQTASESTLLRQMTQMEERRAGAEASRSRQMVQMEERLLLQIKVAILTAENQDLRAKVDTQTPAQ